MYNMIELIIPATKAKIQMKKQMKKSKKNMLSPLKAGIVHAKMEHGHLAAARLLPAFFIFFLMAFTLITLKRQGANYTKCSTE